jgi:hypothetical protein
MVPIQLLQQAATRCLYQNDILNTNKPAFRLHSTKDTIPTISIQSISIQNHSPTISHRLVVGFIPTIGANSLISLPPPPSKLSMSVPPTNASQPSVTASISKQERKEFTSRSSKHADRESQNRTPQSVDGDRIHPIIRSI